MSIEKINYKYCVQDEYGYDDSDLVNKVNELIDEVNYLLKENERLKIKLEADGLQEYLNRISRGEDTRQSDIRGVM